MLEVLPSFFQGKPLPVLYNTLAPALYPVLRHIWKGSRNMKVAWLLLLSYPHFISRWVSSCSRLFSLRSLPWNSPLMVSLGFLKKREKESVRHTAISFLLVVSWLGMVFPPRLEFVIFDVHRHGGEVKIPVVITESANRKDISRSFTHFHTMHTSLTVLTVSSSIMCKWKCIV